MRATHRRAGAAWERALGITFAAACLFVAGHATAAVVTLQSIDEGEYVSSQLSKEFSGLYRATFDGSLNWRNFLVFDLQGVSGQVTGASVFIPGFGTTLVAPSPVTFTLRAVSTSAAILLAGGDNVTNIYSDLADGTLYGSALIQNPSPENNTGNAPMPDVSVSLVGAVAEINSGIGGFLGIVGHVAAPTTSGVFLWRGLNTASDTFKATLTLEVSQVPLPAGAVLLFTGVVALVAFPLGRRGSRRGRSARSAPSGWGCSRSAG